jgi:phage terminase small subunit
MNPPKEKQLTPKQQLFVAEYLIDLNATQAAIRAGYSKKRAAEIGYQVLHKTTIQEAIRLAQEERSKRTEITQDRVLQELAILAYADMADYYEVLPDGSLRIKEFAEMPPGASRAIAGIEDIQRIMGSGEGDGKAIVLEHRRKLKHHDKKGALELCMKHLGMLKDSGSKDNPLVVETYEQWRRRMGLDEDKNEK